MKKLYINIVLIAIVSLFYMGCEDIPNGYIANEIIYYSNPFTVTGGVTTYSETPNLAGSSTPVEFRIAKVKDAQGNETDELTKERVLSTWSAPYDWKKDTTLALVLAKKVDTSMTTMKILPRSGQLLFTESTKDCTPGLYSISLEMTNSAGTKYYEDIVKVNIDSKTHKNITLNWNMAQRSDPPYGQVSDPAGAGGWQTAFDGQYDYRHDPEGENLIELIICDAQGNRFNWKKKEIVPREGLDLGVHTPWAKPILTDSSIIYTYPFVPFPFGHAGNYNEDYQRYQIQAPYVKVGDYISGLWNVNILIGWEWYREGHWTMIVNWPNTSRNPQAVNPVL